MNVYTSVRANVHLIFSFVLWLSRSLTRKQTTKLQWRCTRERLSFVHVSRADRGYASFGHRSHIY